jgi:lipoyl(octanoyl) transferase
MDCYWLGEVSYKDALELQLAIRNSVIAGESDGALLLLTHPPTYTIGRHGRETNILAAPDVLSRTGATVHRVDRGGDVTFHGPGQLVGYPILDLRGIRRGVRDYVCGLSKALKSVASHWGINTHWDEDAPGLWVGRDKLAAFGVHVSRQVTTHGFAINVCPDLDWYRLIVPCGLQDRGVTSLAKLLGEAAPTLSEVRQRVQIALEQEFALNFEYNSATSVLERMRKESYL